jgi:hypothetical protein
MQKRVSNFGSRKLLTRHIDAHAVFTCLKGNGFRWSHLFRPGLSESCIPLQHVDAQVL